MDEVKEREFTELKLELEKLRRELHEAQKDLRKAKDKLDQYDQKNTKFFEANKILSVENSDLQHQCQSKSKQCKNLEAEITNLTEKNVCLNRDLIKSHREVKLCKELQEKQAKASIFEKINLQTLNNKLTESALESDEMKTKYRERNLQCKELEKAKEAAESAKRKLQQDLEKKQSQIQFLEHENAGLRSDMLNIQNSKPFLEVKESKQQQSRLKSQTYALERAQTKVCSLRKMISQMETHEDKMRAKMESYRLNTENEITGLKNCILKLEKENYFYQTMYNSGKNKICELHRQISESKSEEVFSPDPTETEVLQTRIAEQSTLISLLKEKPDELLLQIQALQKVNSELEDKITHCEEKLEAERKENETLEEKCMVVTSNNESLIDCKNDYKRQILDLRERNQQLQSEEECKSLPSKDATVQALEKQIKQLKAAYAQKEAEHNEKEEKLKKRIGLKTSENLIKSLKAFSKIKTLEEKQKQTDLSCQNLKVELKTSQEANSNIKKTIDMLQTEKEKFLQITSERGKQIEELKAKLEKVEKEMSIEEQLRTKAEERFNLESQQVNANAKVKALQTDLEERTAMYINLMREFKAFKKHTTDLLTQQRELNKKLQLMTSYN